MSVFQASDYKEFLHELISKRPKGGYGEVTRLAHALGVNTTFISQVLRGPKDFTFEQAQDVAAHFGLNKLESDYFIHLVLLARAGTKKARDYWNEKLQTIKQKSLLLENRIPSEVRLSEEDRAEFYSSWLYSAIRLSCEIKELGDADSVSEKFGIPKARVIEILDFLLSRGLCVKERDPRTGELKGLKLGPSLTHVEKGSPHLARHHMNWRLKAMQKADALAENDLMLTSPMSLSRSDFDAIREELLACFNSILTRVVKSEPEALVCLNLDWLRFP